MDQHSVWSESHQAARVVPAERYRQAAHGHARLGVPRETSKLNIIPAWLCSAMWQ